MDKQIVFLANVPFQLYGSEGNLKEYGNSENEIHFSNLPKVNGNFNFIFNKRTKEVELFPSQAKVQDYEHIILPANYVDADSQMENWATSKLNESSRNGRWGVYYADSFMHRTLQGLPTEYDFGGTAFTQDVYREILFESANPKNVILLSNVASSPFGYEINYDKSIKNIRFEEIPGQTELHFLDQMVAIDPLNMAKKYGISIGRLPEYDDMLKSKEVLIHSKSFTEIIPEQLPAHWEYVDQPRSKLEVLNKPNYEKQGKKKGVKR